MFIFALTVFFFSTIFLASIPLYDEGSKKAFNGVMQSFKQKLEKTVADKNGFQEEVIVEACRLFLVSRKMNTEIFSSVASHNVKVYMKLEDPKETYALFEKSAAQGEEMLGDFKSH